MNKRYITALLSVAVALLLLSACTADDTIGQGTHANGGVIRFSLRDYRPQTTRTDPDPELQVEREKAVSSVYAVAFYSSTGKFACIAEAADIHEEVFEGDWRANLGQPDVYDVYFLANPNDELVSAIEALTADSEKSDFFAIVASQTPGANASATNFLMTSEEVDVTVDSGADGTLIATPVTVTRAAARIDVVINDDVPLATVTKITLKNRYTTTKVARTGSDVSMTGLTTDDTDYSVSLSGTGKQLLATIYAYEDPSKSTQLVITGTLADGTVVTPTVRFDATHNNMALQRNHLYTVTLSQRNLSTDPLDLGDIDANIMVKDWSTGATIAVSEAQLTSRTAPTFTVAAGTNCTYAASAVTVTDATAAATFTVTVNNTGSTLSKLVCRDQVEGFTVAEGARSVGADGKVVQTFTVTIDANAAASPARTFTFYVENLLDADATGTASFTVSLPATS